MLRSFRSQAKKVKNAMMRGPKKNANPATTVAPAILLLKGNDTEPEIKPLEEYPAWLTNLMQPQLKMKHKIALMTIEDNDAFMPDAEDLKTLLKQHKRKTYREKASAYSMKTKGLFAEEYWEGETDELPVWYSEENVLQRQIEMQLKAKASGEDEDEMVVEASTDKKNYVTNEQLAKIQNNQN